MIRHFKLYPRLSFQHRNIHKVIISIDGNYGKSYLRYLYCQRRNKLSGSLGSKSINIFSCHVTKPLKIAHVAYVFVGSPAAEALQCSYQTERLTAYYCNTARFTAYIYNQVNPESINIIHRLDSA